MQVLFCVSRVEAAEEVPVVLMLDWLLFVVVV